jgi:hypothetical protein
MDEPMHGRELGSVTTAPESGVTAACDATACSPHELFSGLLVGADRRAVYLQPAHRLLRSLLEPRIEPAEPSPGFPGAGGSFTSARALVDAWLDWARQRLQPELPVGYVASWPARVVRELAPVGLSDGAWLRGAVCRGAVCRGAIGPELASHAIGQLLLRGGEASGGDSYRERYAALLISLGTPPASIVRWEWQEAVPCTAIAYEHGLLGLALADFASEFWAEALGYNLWMAALGPAPLLERLEGPLRERRAELRYLQRYERASLSELARAGVASALRSPDAAAIAARIGRGFLAAHTSYARWERAMLGHNVPLWPEQSVLDMIRRKARFAADHHGDLRLGPHNVGQLLREGGRSHRLLLEALAGSRWIKPGAPDQSPLLRHSLSIDGPMFDAFSAAEKLDLEQWVAELGTAPPRRELTPLAPVGRYTRVDEADELGAEQRYGGLSLEAWCECWAQRERHPHFERVAGAHAEAVLGAIERAFERDERLRHEVAPPYSEQAALLPLPSPPAATGASGRQAGEPGSAEVRRYGELLEGWLLQGCIDTPTEVPAERAALLRRYLQRNAPAASAPGRAEPAVGGGRGASERLASVGLLRVEPWRELARLALALSLQPHRFMPEILGLLSGLDAVEPASAAAASSAPLPVRAFMRRVKDCLPSQCEPQWQRLWRLRRCCELLLRGSEPERAALAASLQLGINCE